MPGRFLDGSWLVVMRLVLALIGPIQPDDARSRERNLFVRKRRAARRRNARLQTPKPHSDDPLVNVAVNGCAINPFSQALDTITNSGSI